MIGQDRNIRLAIKGSPGYSLVEFLVAMLILALVSLSWLTIVQVQSTNRESYRREAIEYAGYSEDSSVDYRLDILTGRLGLDYTLNRFLSIFVNGEYQWSFNDEADARYNAYDYDRWRVTAGFRLSY